MEQQQEKPLQLKRPKSKVSRAWDYLSWFLLAAVLAWQAPKWWNTHQRQGTTFQQAEVFQLSGETTHLPVQGVKSVLVFWASWCGPCRIQLGMLKDGYKDGDFAAENIHLINMAETEQEVRTYLADHPMPFTSYLSPDPDAWKKFAVQATPTVLFVNPDGVVDYATTGISPLLNLRIKNFLGQ